MCVCVNYIYMEIKSFFLSQFIFKILINSPGKLDGKKAAIANKYAHAGNNFNRH